MDWLKKLFGGGSGGSAESNATFYYIKGKKCGAVTRLRIDLRNDLSRTEDDHFYVRKVVVDNKCYGQAEVELWFDANYRETKREIQGGEFVSAADWERERS